MEMLLAMHLASERTAAHAAAVMTAYGAPTTRSAVLGMMKRGRDHSDLGFGPHVPDPQCSPAFVFNFAQRARARREGLPTAMEHAIHAVVEGGKKHSTG